MSQKATSLGSRGRLRQLKGKRATGATTEQIRRQESARNGDDDDDRNSESNGSTSLVWTKGLANRRERERGAANKKALVLPSAFVNINSLPFKPPSAWSLLEPSEQDKIYVDVEISPVRIPVFGGPGSADG